MRLESYDGEDRELIGDQLDEAEHTIATLDPVRTLHVSPPRYPNPNPRTSSGSSTDVVRTTPTAGTDNHAEKGAS